MWWVDGKPVEGNATAPVILEVGKIRQHSTWEEA